MIGRRLNAGASQTAVNIFDILPRSSVNNAKRRPSRKFDNRSNLFGRRRNLTNFEIQIRAVETTHNFNRSFDVELSADVATYRWSSSRSQRQYWRRFQFADNAPKLQVIGTEIMSPKRNAVRLIDREQTHCRSRKACPEFVVLKTFGSDIEQLDAPGDRL